LEYRIIPGTPGRSYPFSGIFYKEIVLEKDPGNGTQSARSARKDGANVQGKGSSHRTPLVPVAVLFIGLTAEPFHTHAIWYGMMNALGIFRMDRLVPEDLAVYTRQPHYFWLGEVGMASILAGTFAVPAGIYLAGRAGIALAFILAMIVFMPLFVLMPKLIRGGCRRMRRLLSMRSGRMSR